MEYQFHFGKKFYLDKKNGYWISTQCPRIRAHVFVWEYFNGKRPIGHHIHHIDQNKSNNNIENLACLDRSSHLSMHMDAGKKAKASLWAQKIRPLCKIWHKSQEGRDWHSEHAKEVWKKREPFQLICSLCSSTFNTKTFHQKFCSNVCKSKSRRKNKVDFIFKKCKVCSKEFFNSKYSSSLTCGFSCGVKSRCSKFNKD